MFLVSCVLTDSLQNLCGSIEDNVFCIFCIFFCKNVYYDDLQRRSFCQRSFLDHGCFAHSAEAYVRAKTIFLNMPESIRKQIRFFNSRPTSTVFAVIGSWHQFLGSLFTLVWSCYPKASIHSLNLTSRTTIPPLKQEAQRQLVNR